MADAVYRQGNYPEPKNRKQKSIMTDIEWNKLDAAGQQAAIAMAKTKLVLPSLDAMKITIAAIAKEIGKSPTTGDVNLIAGIRLLGTCKVDLSCKASRSALLQWLMDAKASPPGLLCNASQLGQWVLGKGVKDSLPTRMVTG